MTSWQARSGYLAAWNCMERTMKLCSNLMGIASLGLGILLAGCQRNQDHAPATQTEQVEQTASSSAGKAAPVDARLQQSFLEATLQEPPEDESRPPDETVAGKSVGKIYEQIAGKNGKGGLWEQIVFINADGQRLQYTALIKTELGDVTIELLPDAAPNHVRSFIALVKAGYYDGLAFDRAVHQKVDDSDMFFDCLEAGCPLGTGEPGHGSVGYWLKPEISSKATHDIGMVGACHGEMLESAGAKFYITLTKAPWMDGNWTIFGKVTQGMDVLRAIFQRPVRDEYFRPREPVKIRSATIQVHPADRLGSLASTR
jgi:peptidyl-prolyl cis-trans isomerase B (cyclophilin B)